MEELFLRPMETCSIHINAELEAVFVKKGRVRVYTGNGSFDILENQITVIPPYRLHGFEKYENTESKVYMFSNQSASEFFALCKNKEIKNRTVTLDVDIVRYVESTTDKFLKNVSPFYEKSLLYAFLSEFTRDNSFTQMSFDAFNVNRIIEHIYLNSTGELTAKSVAEDFAISESALNEMLVNYIGFGFKEFLDVLRIETAVGLLHKKENNISQIAYESGFDTLRTFNRVFLRVTGCTPSQYRKTLA